MMSLAKAINDLTATIEQYTKVRDALVLAQDYAESERIRTARLAALGEQLATKQAELDERQQGLDRLKQHHTEQVERLQFQVKREQQLAEDSRKADEQKATALKWDIERLQRQLDTLNQDKSLADKYGGKL